MWATAYSFVRLLRKPQFDVLAPAQHGVERCADRQLSATLGKRLQHDFSRHIAHQRVLSKRTPPKAAKRGVKPPAAGVIGGQHLLRRLLAASVKVRADLH